MNKNISLALDIGANTGQFASDLREAGYKGKIISFEPLKNVFKTLNENSKKDINWTSKNLAIGEYDGKISINESNYSSSSSILEMTEDHLSAKKDSHYISKEEVEIKKLDTIFNNKELLKENVFLKIDTQGYEWQVLQGGRNNLRDIKAILCEVSLVELYKGQKLWLDMIETFKSINYEIVYVEKGFENNKNLRTLQLDIVFVNKKFLHLLK